MSYIAPRDVNTRGVHTYKVVYACHIIIMKFWGHKLYKSWPSLLEVKFHICTHHITLHYMHECAPYTCMGHMHMDTKVHTHNYNYACALHSIDLHVHMYNHMHAGDIYIDIYIDVIMQQVMGLIAGHACANDIVHCKHMYTRQADSCTGHTHYMPCMLELHTRCYYNN